MNFNLINNLYLITGIVIVFLSTYFYVKAARTLNPLKIGPISGAFYFLLILSVIGTTFLMLGYSHQAMAFVRHPTSVVVAYFSTILLFLAFPIVSLIIFKIFRYDPIEHEEYLKKDTLIHKNSNIEFIALVIASLICLLAVLYTFLKIGINNSPILNLIKGTDSETLARLRIMAGNEFPGNQYIKNIFAVALTPFISFITYIYFRKTKKKKWLALFIIMFLASNLISFYNLQKAPIIIYWVSLILLGIYYGDKIPVILVAGLFVFAVIAIILMYRFIVGLSFDQIFSLDGPINRILLQHLLVIFYTLKYLLIELVCLMEKVFLTLSIKLFLVILK